MIYVFFYYKTCFRLIRKEKVDFKKKQELNSSKTSCDKIER
jgi:hypothetical protein